MRLLSFGMMLAMSRLWNTEFLAFYHGDILCGFVYMAKVRKLVFIMFFAVEEELRSKGYGSRILERVQYLYPERKIIISFEPCDEGAEDYPQRVRRKRFYLSNGYQETGYLMKLGGAVQEIVVKNGAFDRGGVYPVFSVLQQSHRDSKDLVAGIVRQVESF